MASFYGPRPVEAYVEPTPRDRAGLRATLQPVAGRGSWYSAEELSSFTLPNDDHRDAKHSHDLEGVAEVEHQPQTAGTHGPSFYGVGPQLAMPKPPARPRRSEQPQRSAAPDFDDLGEQVSAGKNVFIMPKRPPRESGCYALDKELNACTSPSEALDLASSQSKAMDAVNWANLLYALAHFKKKGPSNFSSSDIKTHRCWGSSCEALRPHLSELTARDTANALWSLATLDAKQEPIFLESATALCNSGKLAVCDPVSISKAAWALVAVPSRDKRLELFSQLAVPVVLRADSFPLGTLTMICYAFGKADFREGDAYEALSSALSRHLDEDMRPIDICNIIWAFCTVGYRDDVLFFSTQCDTSLPRRVGESVYSAGSDQHNMGLL